MYFGLLVLISAIATSAVAAYFSIIGLTEIFSYEPAFWSIIIMAGVLEMSKLVMASALWQHWQKLNFIFKGYLSFALVILMVITSMGIFGYLSRAHYEAQKGVAPTEDRIELVDQEIQFNKDKIFELRDSVLEIRKEAASQTVQGYITRTKKALAAIEEEGTIKRFETEIDETQIKIDSLQEKKIKLQSNLRAIESEIGPLKYIAQLIYGDGSYTVIDKAVRLVILLLVIVFDPLAVALLIVANIILIDERKPPPSTQNKRTRRKKKEVNPTVTLDKFLTEVAETEDGEKWKSQKAFIQNQTNR